MLKSVHPLLNGELLRTLSDMGHGDEIVIADAHFPSMRLSNTVHRYDGVSGGKMLEVVLTHFPLDMYVDSAAFRMQVVEDPKCVPEICAKYQNLIDQFDPGHSLAVLPRFDFYERARNAYAIIATGERAQYANIILKKGIVRHD
ncbi:MAG TPA: ribose ABC transporter [Thalassospira sp.]|nr:ribose ABC transporter [Thalassospira sp.]|tara:strand:+ start:144 stop:575 length:432 start_codon:yes stop_codon:yes gene_type:complete